MSHITLGLSAPLTDYLQRHSVHEHPVLTQLRADTAKFPGAQMQISPEQCQLLQWLVRLTYAKTILELGTFAGYSALTMALALPPDGKLYTCDKDANLPTWGKSYWDKAGVGDKIVTHIAPALESLARFAAEGLRFDLAFIDADKVNYLAYYEAILPLVNLHGIIAIDNVLWHGCVVDADNQDKQTQTIRALNDFIYQDPRVDACMLPIGDGLTLARKIFLLMGLSKNGLLTSLGSWVRSEKSV